MNQKKKKKNMTTTAFFQCVIKIHGDTFAERKDEKTMEKKNTLLKKMWREKKRITQPKFVAEKLA